MGMNPGNYSFLVRKKEDFYGYPNSNHKRSQPVPGAIQSLRAICRRLRYPRQPWWHPVCDCLRSTEKSVVVFTLPLTGGLLSTAVLTAVYNRLRKTDVAFSLWAFLLTGVGALGSAIHGGYDLSNVLHPETVPAAIASTPVASAIDPRGLLTFALTGIGLFVIAWLIGRGRQFPRGLGYLGYLAAVLLIVLYLGRLILLNPANPVILGAAVLS